jgi:hypothetical protein
MDAAAVVDVGAAECAAQVGFFVADDEEVEAHRHRRGVAEQCPGLEDAGLAEHDQERR